MNFISLLAVLMVFVLTPMKGSAAQQMVFEPEYSVMKFGKTEINVEVLRTAAEKQKGLSGRIFLLQGDGALFVYKESERSGIWMPKMYFAIDILWLDENLFVVDMKENATPESYPEVFRSRVPALYVLEVPSGYAAKKGIDIGSRAFFQE